MEDKIVDKPILKALREMEVGETVTYSASRTSYIKSACSQFGLEWGKKFKTSSNRENRTITVMRIE